MRAPPPCWKKPWRVQTLEMPWGMADVTTMLGHVAQQLQNYPLAKARYRESLTLYRQLRSPAYVAWCQEGLAATLCAEEHYAQATRLCAAAVTLREQARTPLPLAEREAFEQTVATAKTALDEANFGEEWAIGTAFTHDEAIDYALSDACT